MAEGIWGKSGWPRVGVAEGAADSKCNTASGGEILPNILRNVSIVKIVFIASIDAPQAKIFALLYALH